MGFKLTEKNNFAIKYPNLSKEWHSTKNSNLKPVNFSFGSQKKVWWQCKKGCEWEATIKNRTKTNTGCPFCAGQKVGYGNDLKTNFPKIAKQWHPTKNGDLKPDQFVPGSTKKIWWLCNEGCEWETHIYVRTKGSDCRYCSGFGKRVGYENDFKAHFPKIAKQWHPTKNGDLKPDQFVPGSGRKVWWLCNEGCEWEATIVNRAIGNTGCPFCAGQKVGYGNDLKTNFPKIAKQWHPTKNGELTPNKVTPSSAKKVWWLCKKGHSFEARVFAKIDDNYDCPYCSNRKLGYGNDLENAYPHIAKEWHPTKNGDLLPSNLISGSAKKVWWQCKYGHEWSTSLSHRVSHSSNCPKCTNRVSRPVLFIVAELSTIFKSIDFEKKINDVFVDIFIEDINLIIEYDGAFFHKEKFQQDKLKRKSLIKDGYSLINIRVSPLRKIFKDDITIKSKDNRSFLLISKILNQIINSGIINDKDIIYKANKYLKNSSIQNEKYFFDLTSKFPAPPPGSSLYDKSPHLKDEWHPTKNGEMTIHDYTYASHTKVWWQCKHGHEWKSQIASRYYGRNCPICRHPDLNKKFYAFKDGKKIGPWTSRAQCKRDLKLKNDGLIGNCLKGKSKQYKGFTFEYEQKNDT